MDHTLSEKAHLQLRGLQEGPQKTSQGYEITIHDFKRQKKAKIQQEQERELDQQRFQILELSNSEYKMDASCILIIYEIKNESKEKKLT